MTEPRKIILPVRIDDSDDGGKFLVGLMMVDHDDVEAKFHRLRQRVDAGGAAIDRNQQRRTALGERADRIDVRPITLEDAIRNMHQRIKPALAQEPRQQRTRGCPVHIVVAEDRNLLVTRDGVGETLRRQFHVGERVRVRHQPFQAGLEKILDAVEVDAAAGNDARQQIRQFVPLHDGGGERATAVVEPVAPGAFGRRAFDT